VVLTDGDGAEIVVVVAMVSIEFESVCRLEIMSTMKSLLEFATMVHQWRRKYMCGSLFRVLPKTA
jgi:hypothetical protein